MDVIFNQTSSAKAILTGLFLGLFITAFSQHSHEPKDQSATMPLTFSHVLSQPLADSALTDYKMESAVITVAPVSVDTFSHRHDCELFGYVLDGQVQIALVTKEPKTYSTGQMFYERRNILHTVTRNPDPKKAAKILLIFIIKNGRKGYTAEYTGKK